MSRHAVVVVGGRCRKKREKRRQIELEKEGWSKRKARIHPGARQREGGRRREREISKRVEGGRRGREKRHGGCVRHTVHRTSQSRMEVEKREGGEG